MWGWRPATLKAGGCSKGGAWLRKKECLCFYAGIDLSGKRPSSTLAYFPFWKGISTTGDRGLQRQGLPSKRFGREKKIHRIVGAGNDQGKTNFNIIRHSMMSKKGKGVLLVKS